MPRYVVERSFPGGFQIPITDEGVKSVQAIVDQNSQFGVTWVHSYVSDDKRKAFCICDAPDPEAIRKAATSNSLPVDRINRVSVFDPYFYK
ncbi:MAG: DUF4242 domain-containing protein [Chloroflexota bacterium]